MKYLASFCLAATIGARPEPKLSDQFYVCRQHARRKGLIRKGTDVNMRHPRGGNPLFHADSVGTPEIVRLLIEGGGNVDVCAF